MMPGHESKEHGRPFYPFLVEKLPINIVVLPEENGMWDSRSFKLLVYKYSRLPSFVLTYPPLQGHIFYL